MMAIQLQIKLYIFYLRCQLSRSESALKPTRILLHSVPVNGKRNEFDIRFRIIYFLCSYFNNKFDLSNDIQSNLFEFDTDIMYGAMYIRPNIEL